MSIYYNFILFHILFNSFDLDVEAIVGGRKTRLKEFPFTVSIQFNKKHNCGGTILNGDLVLTARHCIIGKELSNIRIIAGLTVYRIDRCASKHRIENMTIFQPTTANADDLALLKVTPIFNYTAGYRGQVDLPTSDHLIDKNVPLYISGWGRRKKSQQHSLWLMKAKVYLEECNNIPYDGEICTIHHSYGNRGVCKGDSGGPLIQKIKPENKTVLIGIIAGSDYVNSPNIRRYICGSKKYPDRHAKVIYYLDLIREKAKELNTQFDL